MLKIGQGVRIKDDIYKGEIGVIDYIAERKAYPYRIKLNIGGHILESEENLELLPKSWDTLAKGDVIVDDDGSERTVRFVDGDIVIFSMWGCDREHVWIRTKQQLIEDGFTIEEVTELTIDQIAEKFGKPVDKIKIKK